MVVDVDFAPLKALGPPDVVERAFFSGPQGDAGDRHDRLTVGGLSGDDYVAAVALDLGLPVDIVRAAWASVVRFSPGGLALIAEVASRVPVAIWSNTDPIHWAVLSPSLLAITNNVAPSFALGAMKPQPPYFAHALSLCGVPPGEVFFVDDRADNIAAAHNAGIGGEVVRGVQQAQRACRAVLDL